jgi:hypothetical protein
MFNVENIHFGRALGWLNYCRMVTRKQEWTAANVSKCLESVKMIVEKTICREKLSDV